MRDVCIYIYIYMRFKMFQDGSRLVRNKGLQGDHAPVPTTSKSRVTRLQVAGSGVVRFNLLHGRSILGQHSGQTLLSQSMHCDAAAFSGWA